MKGGLYFLLFAAVFPAVAQAGTIGSNQILINPGQMQVSPSSTTGVQVLLGNNSTPLFGYSLDVRFTPQIGSIGTITANLLLTNFFDSHNLITAGGGTRDPIFSQVRSAQQGGVFLSTNTNDLSELLAAPGMNDVLAEVFFDVSPDAQGDFFIELGSASALSGLGTSVPFSFDPGVIHVVPEPASLTLLAVVWLYFPFGRPRHCKSQNSI